VIWLGRTRGHATDWITQLWVRATGREMALSDAPWLDGPAGETRRIGGECFRELAASERLRLEEDDASVRGIVPDLDCLEGPTLDLGALSPGVRRFYEQTSAYELDAWAEWCGAFRPFGWLLAVRADHTLTIFGLVFCRLHYRLRDLRAAPGAAAIERAGG
jgi:hypothetical protein